MPKSISHPETEHPLFFVFVSAGGALTLLTLQRWTFADWAKAHGKDGLTVEAALEDPDVHDALQKAIDRANGDVSRAESIRAFRVLKTDFTEAGGHLTPSMKLKRPQIYQDFASDIESLYSDNAKKRAQEAH